jgi:hypothetical protein
MKNKILKFKQKKIILISILPSCAVILPNPHGNNVVNPIPVKFSLTHQIYKRIGSLILIN